MPEHSAGVNQWAVRLACALVKALHGGISEIVCRQLASRGLQSLAELIRCCGIPPGQVKHALLLLIQHNLVVAYHQRDDESRVPKPAVYMYKADLPAILQIIRRPRYLLHAKEEHGDEAEEIIQVLLENGRLTCDQLVKAIAGRRGVAETEVEEPVKNLLIALVHARYVERAPSCTDKPKIAVLHPRAVKQTRSAKAGSKAAADGQAAAVRTLDEMTRDMLRFKLPQDIYPMSSIRETSSQPSPSPAPSMVADKADAGPSGGAAAAGGAAGGHSKAGRLLKRAREEPAELEELGAVDLSMLEDEGVEVKEGEKPPELEEEQEPEKTPDASSNGDVTAAAAAAPAAPAAKKASARERTSYLSGKRRKTGASEGVKETIAGGVNVDGSAVPSSTVAGSHAGVADRAGSTSGAAGGSGKLKDVLWRVNTEEFDRRFRHGLCVDMAHDKFDADTAAVLEAMLAAGSSYETQLREERGVQLNDDEVVAQLRRLTVARARKRAEAKAALAALEAADKAEAQGDAAGAQASGEGGGEGGDTPPPAAAVQAAIPLDTGMSAEEGQDLEGLCRRVPHIINTLSSDPMEFVSYTGEGPMGSMHCVNMMRFIENLKLKQLEATSRERFGVEGLRIFRMLNMRGQLEQKQVADLAMLPAKDTRELLYRMMKQGFVFMQDIPKTNDRAPSRTFYTWRTDWPATGSRFASQLLQAAGNVFMRSQHELKKHKELIDMWTHARETNKLNFNLTAAQKRDLQKVSVTLNTLEACLLHMDESIALFCDY